LLSNVALAGDPGTTSAAKEEDGGRCLLSDVVLSDHSGASSPVKDEDVFFDARSSVSSSESEVDIYNASPRVTTARPSSSEGRVPVAAAVPEAGCAEGDLLDIFYDARQHASDASPKLPNAAVVSSPHGEDVFVDHATPTVNSINISDSTDNLAPTMPKPEELSKAQPVYDTITAPAFPTPAPRNKSITTDVTTATTTLINTTTSTLPIPLPIPTPTTNKPTPPPRPTHLYGIPLPHTITPITPDLNTPHWAKTPRPPYPALAGRLNIYDLRDEGTKVAENPYCVIIGPLSASARHAWRGDCGKGYLKSKLGGGGGGRQGLALCEMVYTDEGVGYLRALFGTQERAGRAVGVFRGFAW
jgi:hypothetical protein